METFAIISDIHSNAAALQTVLDNIRAREVTTVVCLGDLLTYGCEPNRVIELLLALNEEMTVHFIKGNHDQFYFDLQNGLDKTSYKLPDYIDESVQWTLQALNYPLESTFQWQQNLSLNNCLFSHANPYPYGDWTYLNSDEERQKAAQALQEQGYKMGCFGHTHRANIHIGADNIIILNPGSIGQPRGQGAAFSYIQFQDDHMNFTPNSFVYDIPHHLDRMQKSNLSDATKEKLCSFFKEPT